jgi:hypothetical protein
MKVLAKHKKLLIGAALLAIALALLTPVLYRIDYYRMAHNLPVPKPQLLSESEYSFPPLPPPPLFGGPTTFTVTATGFNLERVTLSTALEHMNPDSVLLLDAIRVLGEKWPDDPDALAALEQVIHWRHDIPEARVLAAQVLIERFPKCPKHVFEQVVGMLEDDDEEVREKVYQKVTASLGWKDIFIPVLKKACTKQLKYRETQEALDALVGTDGSQK